MNKTTVFGFTNCAAFNISPTGDTVWFTKRESRDTALEAKRAQSIRQGLAPAAALSGIFAVESDLKKIDADAREHLAIFDVSSPRYV